MVSLGVHEAKLTAIEVLLLQLFAQNFRNGPAKAADETLADWEQRAVEVLAGDIDSAHYAKEFYAEVRGALSTARK